MPASRIDIDVLVVRKAAFSIEFSIKKDIRRMEIQLDALILMDREHRCIHSESVCPWHTADKYLYIHDISLCQGQER